MTESFKLDLKNVDGHFYPAFTVPCHGGVVKIVKEEALC